MAEEKKLTYKKDSAFDRWDEKMLGAAREYAEGYKKAIDSAKTEREAVVWAKAYLSPQGTFPISSAIRYAPAAGITSTTGKNPFTLSAWEKRISPRACASSPPISTLPDLT